MKRQWAVRISVIACACGLALGLLAGCVNPAATAQLNAASDPRAGNTAYMGSVNQTLADIDAELDLFSEALSRGDSVAMNAEAQKTYALIDDLRAIEAPEGLEDVHEDYSNGAAKTQEALSQYVALYTEIDAASSGAYDYSGYDDRMAQIQSLYDEGIALFKSGDEKAAEKE